MRRLENAKARKERAEEKLAAGKRRPAVNNVRQSIKHLTQFAHRVGSPAGRQIAEGLRGMLLAEADAIKAHLRQVLAGLRS